MTKRKTDKFLDNRGPYTLRNRAKLARKAGDAIELAFLWRQSREGHNYWSGICERLRNISVAAEVEIAENAEAKSAAKKLRVKK